MSSSATRRRRAPGGALLVAIAAGCAHAPAPARHHAGDLLIDSEAALLRLLDESDVAELRSLVKRRLADKIERGDDGELSTLDMLLAEQQELEARQRGHRP